MTEIPKFAKFMAEDGKKKAKKKDKEAESGADSSNDIDMEKLKKEAIEILLKQYHRLKQEAREERSISKVRQAKELQDKIKALHKEKNPLIDELEQITGKEQGDIAEISATTPEGEEIKFELREELGKWKKFYEENNIDWIELPDNISITKEQAEEIKRLIEQFGFDKLSIIPENLANTGERYEKLHELMSKGYEETYQYDNFQKDGGFAGIKNISNDLRIIITKDIQNLDDDKLHKETKGKSPDDLKAEDGVLTQNNLQGLDPATYLIIQREYFQRTGKHLDEDDFTWLPEVSPPESGHFPFAHWFSDGDQLGFCSYSSGYRVGGLGCRLSGSLSVT